MTSDRAHPSRRRFFGQAATALAALSLPGSSAAGSETTAAPREGTPLPPGFPHQDPELVRRIVGASHGDLDTVRQLLELQPELAKASWDWGFGDWESALGAASHTGRREIAELLLAHGARPTLFSAAMLGQLGVVEALVAASPGVQATPGPHGIPLLAHARAGGEPAAPVVAYLESVGGAAGEIDRPELPEPYLRSLVGKYRYGTAAQDLAEVSEGRRGLQLAIGGSIPRGLTATGPAEAPIFHPAGGPSTRIRFETEGKRVLRLHLETGDVKLVAERSGAGSGSQPA